MTPSPGRTENRGLARWMERYTDGDPRAFSHLHALLEPRLRGFLLKLVGDPTPVDDLIQVTLLKAHLARVRFQPHGKDPDGAVQGWYFAIARNVAMDYLREVYRGRKRADAIASDPATPLPSATGDANDGVRTDRDEERLIIERVRRAITELPAGQREVVELHKLKGMTMKEVAQRLEIREGAVRVRAHRAYRALARLLAGRALKGWPP